MASLPPEKALSNNGIVQKTIGLFTYLKKIAELRTRVVHNVDDYEYILWFSDIPNEPECFTPAQGEIKPSQEEIWLGIKKVNFIKPPPLPNELRPWVIEEDLLNSSDIPNLQEKILNPKIINEDAPPTYLELSDYPDISEQWEEYLDERWFPWAEENERLLRIQKVYSKLHSMYQLHKTLGETYELVIGLGLLSWKTPSNNLIRRPLIVGQASIELDTKRGNLYVKQGADGTKLSLEEDMLDLHERCGPDVYKGIQEQFTEIGDEIWNTQAMETVLKTWVHSVSAEGIFLQEWIPYQGFPTGPRITFAPVLILRKRNIRNLLNRLEQIIEQTSENHYIDNNIPFNIKRSVELIGEEPPALDKSANLDGFNEIFFPLPSNNEQREIINRFQTSQGVVVQGPPGTGKSHTITNLICHLLAEGKRILISSQTPRALKVLKKMIPKEIAPLCVNLLGHDNESLEQLKASVEGIRHQKLNYVPEQNRKSIERLIVKLEDLRKRQAELQRQLREIRERETYEHRICDGIYSGTAQEIARQVSLERANHGWLDITASAEVNPPLSDEEAIELTRLYQNLSLQNIEELGKELIPTNKLPTPKEFARYSQDEQEAKIKYAKFGCIRENSIYQKIKNINDQQLTQLKSELQDFLQTLATLRKHKQSWVRLAIDDILSGRDSRWGHLLEETEKCIERLQNYVDQIDKCFLKIPEGYDRASVKADAEILLKYLEHRGKLGWFILRPKEVKKAQYLVKSSYIDGKLCDNADDLKKLIILLEVDESLDNMWHEWSEYTNRPTGSRGSQLHDLEDLCKPLSEAMKLYSQMAKAKQTCAGIPGLAQPAWYVIEDVEYYSTAVDSVAAEKSFEKSGIVFNEVQAILRECMLRPHIHPIVGELHRAITNRDESTYKELYEKMVHLECLKVTLAQREKLYSCLFESPAKSVAQEFITNSSQPHWSERFSHFSKSWQWAQANTWLREYVSNLSEEDILTELNSVEKEISSSMIQIASKKAWEHCLTRLTESERFHLMSWADEMRKVGKGTGKYAELNRSNARKHMEQCRSAIPAWIMPLYRVAETVEPAINTYDVVIIDEASQSSATDAYFLFYYAKKIIVVGDPEQISPLSSGINLGQVNQLKELFIKDVQIKDALSPNNSFFNLSSILFPARVDLREHFRCMPEIIQFSNNLCYSSTPLKPLRQYPPKRLEPIKTYHVKNGYRDGDTRTAFNLPEAESVAAKIKECCNSREYDGKTMGVISLLGEYQARKIEEKLLKEIGPEEMAQRNIVCGDAYAFQGDERDVIFMSMVAAPGDTIMKAEVSYPIKQRFNVAASRARDQMWLFHTPTLNDFRNHECLRYRLLEYCLNPKKQLSGVDFDIQQLRNATNTANRMRFRKPGEYDNQFTKYFDSWFEADVFLKIIDKGYQAIPQFEVASYHIDTVIEGEKGRLAVECDGDKWHSEPEQKERDMERERILKRCGWTFWRIRGSEFYSNQIQALEPLWNTLDELGIAPAGKDKVADNTTSTRSKILGGEIPTEQSFTNAESLFPTEAQIPKGRLDFSSEELQDAIVGVLKQCPNNTCTKKSLTSRVCRYLRIITRGQPRQEFEKRIMKSLDQLKVQQIVEEYRATNLRIRLIRPIW